MSRSSPSVPVPPRPRGRPQPGHQRRGFWIVADPRNIPGVGTRCGEHCAHHSTPLPRMGDEAPRREDRRCEAGRGSRGGGLPAVQRSTDRGAATRIGYCCLRPAAATERCLRHRPVARLAVPSKHLATNTDLDMGAASRDAHARTRILKEYVADPTHPMVSWPSTPSAIRRACCTASSTASRTATARFRYAWPAGVSSTFRVLLIERLTSSSRFQLPESVGRAV